MSQSDWAGFPITCVPTYPHTYMHVQNTTTTADHVTQPCAALWHLSEADDFGIDISTYMPISGIHKTNETLDTFSNVLIKLLM